MTYAEFMRQLYKNRPQLKQELQQFRRIRKFLEESNRIEDVDDDFSHINALEAWFYIEEQDQLTPEVILATHKILMKDKLFSQRGYYRTCQVYVGGREMPKWELVPYLIQNWCDKYKYPLGEEALDAHIEFECIHPFIDGNGRMGRLLLLWHRVKSNHSIVVYYAAKRKEYYKLFSN